MPYKNKDQQKEFQRRWCQKRRALWLAIFANQCWTCGSEKNLDFDHIDPKTKITHRLWSRTAQFVASELAKCQLLCRSCHVTKTHRQRA